MKKSRKMKSRQRMVPAVFMRGGTSKGVFFHAEDLPPPGDERDRLLLRVLGSPDPFARQLDGMGGGISSLSKAVILSRSQRSDADIDYLFAQVAVDRLLVDYGGPCGNLSSAVGPFALEQGLMEAEGDTATIRIWNVNTSKLIIARFAIADGLPLADGDFMIPGLASGGARIDLDYVDPGGSRCAAFLPTGNAVDRLSLDDGSEIDATIVDAAMPVVVVRARDVGLSATETPDQIEADVQIMNRLEAIRVAGGRVMGLANKDGIVGLGVPKLAIVAPPARQTAIDGSVHEAAQMHFLARVVSMGRVHKVLPLTVAMCLAAGGNIEGSLIHACASLDGEEVRIGNPSGVLPVAASVRIDDGRWRVDWVRSTRTARTLMAGHVLVPDAGEMM